MVNIAGSGREIIVGRKKKRSASWREAEVTLEVGKYGYSWASTKKDAF